MADAEIETAGAESPALPDGEYAILEMLGHRTLVGRVTEVERFGTKFLSLEPLLRGELLPPLLIGGASLYAFTPCTAETAALRSPKERYQLPATLAATLPPAALPAPSGTSEDEGPEPEFAPGFLDQSRFDHRSQMPSLGADDDDDGIPF